VVFDLYSLFAARHSREHMIDHVSIAVRDLARATAFYEAVLARIGYAKLEVRAATVGFGKRYSELWLNHRPEMLALPDATGAQSNGVHVCLRAPTTAAVDAFHAAALAAGGASDGSPGLRPHHGEGYYAAFIRDPDGNRIEAVTFLARAP
jgi:catechol 2,3-dioxygenase-like lactoylglutathione lyase family enzyme